MQPSRSGALARRGELALAEVLRETALRCGGVVLHERGLLLVAGTHPCPVFVTSALRTGPIDAQAVVDRADRFFRERGRAYDLWTRIGPDAVARSKARSIRSFPAAGEHWDDVFGDGARRIRTSGEGRGLSTDGYFSA